MDSSTMVRRLNLYMIDSEDIKMVELLKKDLEEKRANIQKLLSEAETAYMAHRFCERLVGTTAELRDSISRCVDKITYYEILMQIADRQLASMSASAPAADPTTHTSSPKPADGTQ